MYALPSLALGSAYGLTLIPLWYSWVMSPALGATLGVIAILSDKNWFYDNGRRVCHGNPIGHASGRFI